MEHTDDPDSNCSWCTCNGLQKFGKGIGRIGNVGESRYHPVNIIVQMGQNTQKCLVYLKRLDKAIYNKQKRARILEHLGMKMKK